MSIDELFGKDFLEYIEVQKKAGKTLEDIALENGKTKEAIRSKIKREKQKLKKGIVSTQVLKEVQNEETAVQKIVSIENKKPQPVVEKKVQDKIGGEENLTLKNIVSLLEKIELNTRGKGIEVGEKKDIEIPYKFNEVFSTSIRVDKSVWNDFKEFSKENKYIKQQDLVSLALKEFIEKYKK